MKPLGSMQRNSKCDIKQITICGEVYSDNLGDGVIADCLQYGIRQVRPELKVSFLDISNRTSFGMPINHAPGRRKIKWLKEYRLVSFLGKLRNYFLWHAYRKSHSIKAWRSIMAPTEMCVIGGGQLLMDNQLNFPLKLSGVIKCARDLEKRVAFYSCGVGNAWGGMAKRIFRKILFGKKVELISVRDEGSYHNLKNMLPSLATRVDVSHDPAVLAAEAYGASPESGSHVIGLGVAASEALLSRTNYLKRFKQSDLVAFWLELAICLEEKGCQFRIFVNGSKDDYDFACRVHSAIKRSGKLKRDLNDIVLPKPRTPYELVGQIGQFQAVIAHRLHANIIAYSLGLPTIGLIWDPKVEWFGQMTRRDRFYLRPEEAMPDTVVARLDEAINCGVNPTTLATVKKRCAEAISSMLDNPR